MLCGRYEVSATELTLFILTELVPPPELFRICQSDPLDTAKAGNFLLQHFWFY